MGYPSAHSPIKKTHLTSKPHLFWFYICGFNITILAGLFSSFFGRLLGRRRRVLGRKRLGLAAALSGVMISL
jgi:hypothetical protein